MRKVIMLATILAGFALGIAIGYFLATAEAVSNTPFLVQNPSKTIGFDRIEEDFARLGGYESVAAKCQGSVDIQPTT